MKKLTEQLIQLSENLEADARDTIKVDVHIKDYFDDVDCPKVETKLTLEVETREWGIKGIYLELPEKMTISYKKEEDDDYKSVEIDTTTANIEWTAGKIYSITEIEVRLDKDEKVKEVIVHKTYIDPNE